MEAITRDNYESFFLDFAEGNLSDAERAAVLAFVADNPDLAEDLEVNCKKEIISFVSLENCSISEILTNTHRLLSILVSNIKGGTIWTTTSSWQ